MKCNDVHVVFNENAASTFKRSELFDLNTIELIVLQDYPNYGPVCDVDSSEEEITRREQWLTDVNGEKGAFSDDYLFQFIRKDLLAIKEILRHSDQGSNLYLWTGVSAAEVAATARLLYHISEYKGNIFMTPFSTIPTLTNNGTKIFPNILSSVKVSDVKLFADKFSALNLSDFLRWQKKWSTVRRSTEVLRILSEGGGLIDTDENHFDDALLANCGPDYESVAWVVGLTLCKIDFAVDDAFLNWRLKQLASQGNLAYTGELKDMRSYQVKRPL